jgi:hypothetical protein
MRVVRPAARNQARFLHVGKWEPRKNQHRLIGAFLDAFEPHSPNFLHLHCKPFWGAKPYPVTFDESRHLWLEADWVKAKGWTRDLFESHITCTWNTTLPRPSLCVMYAAANVYVSSGRSEGFDLCAFDGKLAGHLMVHMGYGGPQDFATDTDIAVAYEQMDSPPNGYLVPPGCQWPNPTVIEYSKALRQASEKIRSNQPLTAFQNEPFRIDAVGHQLAAAVEALALDHDLTLEAAGG